MMLKKLSFIGLALATLVGSGALATTATGCGDDDPVAPGPKPENEGGLDPDAAAPEPFKATVRRTSLGVPHIKADNLGGLGYGYGYAFAEDNICLLLEEIITVRGERAKWFGDVAYDLGNTGSRSNVNSDAVYKMLMTKDVIDKSRAALDADMQSMIRGYAAGASRYVRELKEGKYPGRHATCRSEGWLREINDEDMYLRFYKLSLLASSANFIDGLAAAQPMNASIAPPPGGPKKSQEQQNKEVREGLEKIAPKFMKQRTGDLGSNMYAFGSEVTESGKGIQFGNPHFPWFGGERLYQVHLTVPGKIDIQGASLYGVPVVLIGFTDTFAWSHTVSTAYRFTPYQLKLKAGDPMTYIQDGAEKKITAVPLEVEVKGEATKRTVTLYKSEYGPMIYLGNSLFNWDTDQAFTIRDANAENYRLIRHFARWNMAKSLEEFKKIHAEEVAVPWVNTTAADKDGNVYYGDITVVPNVPNTLAESCKAGRSGLLAANAPGLPLLDGSKAACNWVVDPASPQPGIFAAASLPTMSAKDWVVNCNDSYWLTNTKRPITGFATIIGREAYEQSLRSRLCHQQVLDRAAGTDGEPGTKFNVDNVKKMVLGSRVFSAEKMKKRFTDVLCGATPAMITLTRDPLNDKPFTPPVQVDPTAACAALAAWTDRDNTDSKGSALWDEFWFRIEPFLRTGNIAYTKAFDPADPVNTPNDPATTNPDVAQCFGAAIESMKAAGIALDSERSVVSYRQGKGGEADRIPIPGGFQRTGNFTIAQTDSPSLKAGVGYGPMQYGNSYIQVVTWTDAGPDASTFVTYSQSSDTASEHYDDYTRRYSTKDWLKASFTEAEVAADTKATVELQQ